MLAQDPNSLYFIVDLFQPMKQPMTNKIDTNRKRELSTEYLYNLIEQAGEISVNQITIHALMTLKQWAVRFPSEF